MKCVKSLKLAENTRQSFIHYLWIYFPLLWTFTLEEFIFHINILIQLPYIYILLLLLKELQKPRKPAAGWLVLIDNDIVLIDKFYI